MPGSGGGWMAANDSAIQPRISCQHPPRGRLLTALARVVIGAAMNSGNHCRKPGIAPSGGPSHQTQRPHRSSKIRSVPCAPRGSRSELRRRVWRIQIGQFSLRLFCSTASRACSAPPSHDQFPMPEVPRRQSGRYSAAKTLFVKPSSAYRTTASSFWAQRISPTGGFSPSWTQCSRA